MPCLLPCHPPPTSSVQQIVWLWPKTWYKNTYEKALCKNTNKKVVFLNTIENPKYDLDAIKHIFAVPVHHLSFAMTKTTCNLHKRHWPCINTDTVTALLPAFLIQANLKYMIGQKPKLQPKSKIKKALNTSSAKQPLINCFMTNMSFTMQKFEMKIAT